MKGLYKGFYSWEFDNVKQFQLTDLELVKVDLLNHIYTKRGSRVMMAEFGTIIPEIIFEPLDEDTLDLVKEELLTVFEYDPRVELLQFEVVPDYDNNTIFVNARLLYIELNMEDDFMLNIEFKG